MVGKAESPSNPPLWVKLDFKTVQVPSLVDTGAQFSCIRKDVMSKTERTLRAHIFDKVALF